MVELKLNDVYKICTGEDIELNKDYSYFVCVGEKDNYYILYSFDKYCVLNGLDPSKIDDIDTYFSEVIELDIIYFKQYNNLESIYHKSEEIQEKVKELPKRKFTIV